MQTLLTRLPPKTVRLAHRRISSALRYRSMVNSSTAGRIAEELTKQDVWSVFSPGECAVMSKGIVQLKLPRSSWRACPQRFVEPRSVYMPDMTDRDDS